jgi:long-chain acyl-CoA synthetase
MKYKNLPDLFNRKCERYLNKVLIRYKTRMNQPFIDVTWKETRQKIEEISAGMHKLGIERGDTVGLLSATNHHWLACDFSILSLGAVTVPLYHNATSESVQYIVNHCSAKITIVRNKIQLQKLRACWDCIPNLQYVIVMEDRGDIPSNDPRILTLDEVRNIGSEELKKNPMLIRDMIPKIQADDMASIIYTSGTTGTPKGVVLTHKNILVAALSFYQYVPLEEGFRLLSFLPLAHVFERIASEFYGIDQGCIFSYCERVEDLPKMLVETDCNLINVVPRLLEKIHAKILNKVSTQSPLKQKIFNLALDIGLEYARKKSEKETISWDLELKYNLALKGVLGKIKQQLAPSLKIFVVGGAPFSKELNLFFMALGFTIVEGYGLTETSAPISVNPPWANKPGTVGIPFKHFDVKIAEDGEIICRGDSVFKEYYKDPEATNAVIIDGWFHTGDLGSFDEEGYLSITGRKKDLIITASGKNVSPARVEEAILKSKYISQAVILGDKEKYLASLIVLEEAEIQNWLEQEKLTRNANEDLNNNQKIRELIEFEITQNTRHLDRHEQIKAFHILNEELTIDGGELTPTLKVKRNVVREKYANIIKPLFNKPSPSQEG